MTRLWGASACAVAVCAALTTGVYAGQNEDALVKGATILAEARKAVGGADKLAAIQRLEARGSVRRAAGDVNLEGDLRLEIEVPTKYRREESIILGGGGAELNRVEVLNGTESWEEMKFGGGVNFDDADGGARGGRQGAPGAAGQGGGQSGQPAADPERQREQELRSRQTEVARVLLATLLATDVPVRWIGTAVSPQATAEVLEIRTADNTPTRLLIDSKTYMPLMLSWTGVPQDPIAALAGRAGFRGRGRGGRGGFGFPGGGFPGRQGGGQGRGGAQAAPSETRADALLQPTTLQMFLSDYRTVNGIKLPHLMIRGAGDQVIEEWIVRNYRVNPNFKADLFSKQ